MNDNIIFILLCSTNVYIEIKDMIECSTDICDNAIKIMIIYLYC